MADPVAEHRRLLDALDDLRPELDRVVALLIETFAAGGRLYTIGNGGSACDAQHLAEELVGRYLRDRRPLPATALSADPSALTCIGNDFGFEEVFARQVRGHVRRGDVVAAFSTSGRSANVVAALAAARELGAATVLFGGGEGGPARAHADHALVVPSSDTARVQEIHVLLVHLLLDPIDAWAAAT